MAPARTINERIAVLEVEMDTVCEGQKEMQAKLDRIGGRVLLILVSIVVALLGGLGSILARAAGL